MLGSYFSVITMDEHQSCIQTWGFIWQMSEEKQEENIVFEIFSHSNIKQQLEQIFDKNW